MSVIISADWHLTNKSRDEYRWCIFNWLANQEADELLILGDLCDQKDRHDAIFVNRLYQAMVKLCVGKFRVIILKGNHDYIDPDHAFFTFLGDIADSVFVSKSVYTTLSIGKALFVPAGEKWDFKINKVAQYIFTHATFMGAEAENGTRLTGVDTAVLNGFAGRVFSGDIHVPQKLHHGLIEYVGAPYHIRFGDSFEPRLVYIGNDGKTSNLYFPAPKKHTFTITEPDHLYQEKATKGDQVKVRCLLRRAQYDLWPSYRTQIQQIADKHEWVLCGIEPVVLETTQMAELQEVPDSLVPAATTVADYVERQKAGPAYLKAGLALLKSVEGSNA